ncbi:NAC domain-containing protein 14 [Linum perenne]
MAAAVGYRFHPTDEELITHYLKLKMNGHDSLVDKVIPEVDVYRSEPSDLPNYSVMGSSSDDQVWYFYCRLDYKYKNSKRANRATESGFWKVTGKPRFIVARDTGEQIGVKKTLVFFYRARGDAKPVSTDWVIHQYQATTLRPDQTEYVICKLKNKGECWTKNSAASTSGEPSHCTSAASDAENHGLPVQVSPFNLQGDSDGVVGDGPRLYIDEGISMDDLFEGVLNESSVLNESNSRSALRFDYDDEEEEVDPDSFLIIPDDYLSNETAYAQANDYRPEKALSTYHAEDDVKEVSVITPEVPEMYQVFAGKSSSRKVELLVKQSMASKDEAEERTSIRLVGGKEPPHPYPTPQRSVPTRSVTKLRSNAPGKAIKVRSLIRMVEVPVIEMQCPPTVYMVNIMVAVLVFAFFIWK